MKSQFTLTKLGVVWILFSILAGQRSSFAQGADFTYQGRLNDGSNPATGIYDLRFALFYSTNSSDTPFAGPVTNTATGVSNGLFTVILDFGAGAFPGADTWLEVAVRTNGGSSFVTLAPRQKVTPTPYALYALNAANANLANNVYATTILQAQALQVGVNNTITTSSASIAGGMNNTADGNSVSVGGGSGNYALGDYAAVAGGENNSANGDHSFIGGGSGNSAMGYDVVVGGLNNTVGADKSGIGSGDGNTVLGYASWIGGGQSNLAFGNYCVVGGGYFNTNIAVYGTVSGGRNNTIQTNTRESTIGGGYGNTIQIESWSSTINGGYGNTIQSTAPVSTIGGGNYNTIQTDSHTSTIGGGSGNTIGTNSQVSTINGGYGNTIQAENYDSTIGGGVNNTIQTNASNSTISGGLENTIQFGSYRSTISGGNRNTIQADSFYSTIGGGVNNTIYDTSRGSIIAGGYGNSIAAFSSYSTIAGGFSNIVAASGSFAAGQNARVFHSGSFVWSDSQNAPFASTAFDQFSVRAKGGVRLNTDTSLYFGSTSRSVLTNDQGGSIELGDSTHNIDMPYIDFHYGLGTNQDFNVRMVNDGEDQLTIKRSGSATPMAQFTPGGLEVNGAVVLTSDRNQKENFQSVDASDVLTKVATLPLSRWNYKDDTRSTHLGPMAQDFYAAFGVGPDDKHIATVDADGVALAAIQGLNEKIDNSRKTTELRIQKLEAENADLKQTLNSLNELVQTLSHKLNGGSK